MIEKVNPDVVFEEFLGRLSKAFASGSTGAVQDLFLPNGYLRDILVTEWTFNSIPRDDVPHFFDTKGFPTVSNVRVDQRKPAPAHDALEHWIMGFFAFDTPVAHCEGVARLQRLSPSSDGSAAAASSSSTHGGEGPWKALTLSLVVDSYVDFPELSRKNRPRGLHGKNWAQVRAEEAASFDSEANPPQVLILGAGHNGLMLAARLKRLGVKTLLVDRNERLGDSWRMRYPTLVLRDVIWAINFPYLPFPDDWPIFVPKDKLADWFESYASIMDLNVWLKTEVVEDSTSYDEATGEWTTSLRRGDGSIRKIRCHHIVQATGAAGKPKLPPLKNVEKFKGVAVHSSGHKGSEGWEGKRAIVVGSCNSAHDIAQNFSDAGAEATTMVQRGSTLVISSDPGLPMSYRHYPAYTEGGPPLEQSDLAMVSFPLKAMEPYLIEDHRAINEVDKPMLEGLERAGFKLNGDGTAGWLRKYWNSGGGYHTDVGGAQLIIDGRIKVKQGVEIAEFEEDGVRFTDGSYLGADVVVFATGFHSMRETARDIVGSKVADRIGPIWGLDKQGELNGVWRRSGHPGYWFTCGAILLARTYSKYLALQIKAIEEGLAPK